MIEPRSPRAVGALGLWSSLEFTARHDPSCPELKAQAGKLNSPLKAREIDVSVSPGYRAIRDFRASNETCRSYAPRDAAHRPGPDSEQGEGLRGIGYQGAVASDANDGGEGKEGVVTK